MNKTTKIIIGIIVAVIIIGGIWYLMAKDQKSEEEMTIKIGLIGHFTGEYASYVMPMKNAVELALREANDSGGINGKKLVLIVEDDAMDAIKAATGMNKLINIDNVNYVISAQGSGVTSAITPIAQNNKNILMITLGSAPNLTKEKDYVFRSCPSDVYQASEMVEYLNNTLKPQKIAGIYRNDPYGIGIRDIIEKESSADVVASELYVINDSDFKTQLTKIKKNNPDVLIIAGAKNDYPLMLKQINELGLSSIILASETFYDQDLLNKIGETNREVYTLFQKDPTDYLNFEDKYIQEFREDPSVYSMYAYDGMVSLIMAIENSGDDIEKIKASLLGLSFNGASGIMGFNSEGDRTGAEYSVYKVEDGEFKEIK